MNTGQSARIYLLCLALFAGSSFAGEPLAGQEFGKPSIHAEQVIENTDASKTFTTLWLRSGAGDSTEQHRISRGVPGICKLFGMDGFLQDYVVRSDDIRGGVELSDDGMIVAIRSGYYIESVTCTAAQPYWPRLIAESIEQHADGSITALMPTIHTGPETFRIVSGFTAGACRLLGYNTVVKHSLVWSEQRVAGVSISMDGRIYSEALDTHLTSISCKNVSQEKFSSAGRARFDEEAREYREQQQEGSPDGDEY